MSFWNVDRRSRMNVDLAATAAANNTAAAAASPLAVSLSVDGDDDGYSGCTDDCDDADMIMYPGATEVCNGFDDDCDGTSDQVGGRDLRRDLRELAMSYFHEYFNNGRKTLRTYSVAFDLRRFAPETWITGEEDCWDVGAALDDARHYRLIKPAQMRWLMPPDATVLRADDLVQYESRDRKTARKY